VYYGVIKGGEIVRSIMKSLIKKALSHRPSLEISVGTVLFLLREREPQFLLLHYPHGHWDFIKGHVEEGESYEETMLREIREESGIGEVEILDGFQEEVKFRYTAKGTEREKRQRKGSGLYIWKKVIYFTAQTQETRVEISDEHVDWAWLSYEDTRRRITHANSKRVLDGAKRHIDKMYQ